MTTDSPLRSRVSRWARKLDAVVGNRVEQALTAHHRRRLARLGHSGALATPAGGWASGPPPRPGNSFEVLVDGAEARSVQPRGFARRDCRRPDRGDRGALASARR